MTSGSLGRVSSKSSKTVPADVQPTSSLYRSLSSEISDSRRPNLIRRRRRFFFFGAGRDFGFPFGFFEGGALGLPFGGGPRFAGGFFRPFVAGFFPSGAGRLRFGGGGAFLFPGGGPGGLPFFLGVLGSFFFSLAASSKSSASTAFAICCLISASEEAFFFGGGGAFFFPGGGPGGGGGAPPFFVLVSLAEGVERRPSFLEVVGVATSRP